MNELVYLIPISLCLGAIGLGAFLWSLKSGQYEDLDGDAERILFDEEDKPMFGRSISTPENVDTNYDEFGTTQSAAGDNHSHKSHVRH